MTVKVGSARIICLGILLSAALMATSCIGTIQNIAKPAKFKQYKDFFDLPLDKQYKKFESYPIEKQFDVYILAMMKKHPHDMNFAIYMARKGKDAVPFLVNKLRQENYSGYGSRAATRENIKEKTIFLLRLMSRQNYYAVKNDEDAIKAIRSEIEKMQDPLHRRLSNEYLWEILEEY
jgi:hypothetical protein